jgi:hypothetical protein
VTGTRPSPDSRHLRRSKSSQLQLDMALTVYDCVWPEVCIHGRCLEADVAAGWVGMDSEAYFYQKEQIRVR